MEPVFLFSVLFTIKDDLWLRRHLSMSQKVIEGDRYRENKTANNIRLKTSSNRARKKPIASPGQKSVSCWTKRIDVRRRKKNALESGRNARGIMERVLSKSPRNDGQN